MPFDQHRKFEHIWALKYRRCNKLVSCFVNSQNHGIKNNAIFVLHVTNACVLQKVCTNGSVVITCPCPWYLILAQHSSIVMPGVSSNPHPVFQSSRFWVAVTVSFSIYSQLRVIHSDVSGFGAGCPCRVLCCGLTHWGRDKMDAVSQTTLSKAFSWMKMLEFRLRFHWSFFLRVQLTIVQHWFR